MSRSPAARREADDEPAGPSDDGLPAITSIGGWVTNADTKIGVLAVVLAALAIGIVRQHNRAETLLRDDLGARAGVGLAALAGAAILTILATVFLIVALTPRLTTDSPSRFSFPHLAIADLDQLLLVTDRQPIRREALAQAQVLARMRWPSTAHSAEPCSARLQPRSP